MKIYDCFTFFNELELLDIRFNTLNDAVDYFVIVEARHTFQGQEKGLYFGQNRGRYSRFDSKIIHVVVDEFPETDEPFDREAHQRNCILVGLEGVSATDRVVISDVDEIPRPEILCELTGTHLVGLRQQLFYYYVNLRCDELDRLPWSMSGGIDEIGSPQLLRDKMIAVQAQEMSGVGYDGDIVLLDQAGWHFSYLGGVSAIREKIRAFSHVEYNTSEFLNEEYLLEAIGSETDLFGRELHFSKIAVDGYFPEYLKSNSKKFSHLIVG